MYLSDERLIFVHIPKCAGTSVERTLLEVSGREHEPLETTLLQKNRNPLKGPPSFGHLRAEDYVKKGHVSPQEWRQCFKFAIVRNPLARLVSAYNFRGVSWRARIRGRETWSFREYVLEYFPRWFDENYLRGHDNWTHVRPMWTMLFDRSARNLLVDYVCRMETLAEDFGEVCRRTGLPEGIKLKRENSSVVKDPATGRTLEAEEAKPPWQAYYDEETLRFARDFYRRDFELFDYSNEL